MSLLVFLLITRRPTVSTITDPLFPYTTPFLSPTPLPSIRVLPTYRPDNRSPIPSRNRPASIVVPWRGKPLVLVESPSSKSSSGTPGAIRTSLFSSIEWDRLKTYLHCPSLPPKGRPLGLGPPPVPARKSVG